MNGMPMNAARAQKSAVLSSVAAYIMEKAKSQTATEVVRARKRRLMRDARSRMTTVAPSRKTSVPVASVSATRGPKRSFDNAQLYRRRLPLHPRRHLHHHEEGDDGADGDG